jgi:hypothetical protein
MLIIVYLFAASAGRGGDDEACIAPATLPQLSSKVDGIVAKIKGLSSEPLIKGAIIKSKICEKFNPKEKFGRGRGRGGGGGGGGSDSDGPGVCMDPATIGAAIQACKTPDAPSSCASELSAFRGSMTGLCASLEKLECPPALCSNPALTGAQTEPEPAPGPVGAAAGHRNSRGDRQPHPHTLLAGDSSAPLLVRAPRAQSGLALGLGVALVALALVKLALGSARGDPDAGAAQLSEP